MSNTTTYTTPDTTPWTTPDTIPRHTIGET